MTTVYISIGNSDDKLTQNEWSLFHAATDHAIRRGARLIHGAWTSDPTAPWQNACWCIETMPDPASAEHLKMRLTEIATTFRQDSIAWAEVAKTEFLGVPATTPAAPVAPNGCDNCSVEPGETHRYPGCPGASEAAR